MATSSSQEPSAAKSNKRGRFAQLIASIRRKQSRRGIVEIDEAHEAYELACCMQEGLTWSPEATLDVEKSNLTPEDFSEVVEARLIHDVVNKKFIFRSYAPKVFLCLRRDLDINEEFYQESLSPDNQQVFLQFMSNSKGGQNFFLSNNKCYMIKTESRTSALFFMRMLTKYFDHLERYPHSLLVRFLGLHFIQVQGQKPLYFTVMQSIFYPNDRIQTRYDLKACTAKRYERPEPEDSEIVSVLKDINFSKDILQLGSQKDWFCRQIAIDTDFLDDLHVMDYSLLVGRHRLHPSEIPQQYHMADVVRRVVRSYQFQHQNGIPSKSGSNNDSAVNSSNNNALGSQPRRNSDSQSTQLRNLGPSHPQLVNENEGECELEVGDSMLQTNEAHVSAGKDCNFNDEGYYEESTKSHPLIHSGVSRGDELCMATLDDSILPGVVTSDSRTSLLDDSSNNVSLTRNKHVNEDIARDDNEPFRSTPQNMRYLPDVSNATHIIDGPTERYYLGIIDLFTEYTARKKLEHILKAVLHPNLSHSTVSPRHYRERFCKFFHSQCE